MDRRLVPVTRRQLIATTVAIKVPEITGIFWVIKILTTGAGEAASDYVAARNLVLAAGIGLIGFVASLGLQLRTGRYVPWIYWLAMSSVAGEIATVSRVPED
jgi:uncharacterized membrane-anchored protein